MIVRVIKVRATAGRVGQLNALMRRRQAEIRDQPGVVYTKLARRLEPDGGEEVVLIEEWRDPGALYAWAGSDISDPRLAEGSGDSVLDASVTTYESLDIDFDDPDRRDTARTAEP